MRLIDADSVLRGIDDLRKSPWYNVGKEIGVDPFAHVGFLERREAIQVIVDLCIKKEPTISGWVSVEDRLPEEPGSYLCWFGKNKLAPGIGVETYIPRLGGFGSLEYYKIYDNITHWMPLPEGPEVEK